MLFFTENNENVSKLGYSRTHKSSILNTFCYYFEEFIHFNFDVDNQQNKYLLYYNFHEIFSSFSVIKYVARIFLELLCILVSR